jgi:hypothetical protein
MKLHLDINEHDQAFVTILRRHGLQAAAAPLCRRSRDRRAPYAEDVRPAHHKPERDSRAIYLCLGGGQL